jgi:hypothetical protein
LTPGRPDGPGDTGRAVRPPRSGTRRARALPHSDQRGPGQACREELAGDGRGDRRPDQVRRVVASLVGIAGDDHDQVQAGDDLNELAAIAHGAEAVVAALIGHPPLVARCCQGRSADRP